MVTILLVTLVTFLYLNLQTLSTLTSYRIETVWTLISGLADLFISCMLWFIMAEKAPDVIKQGNRAYNVLDVVKSEGLQINDD